MMMTSVFVLSAGCTEDMGAEITPNRIVFDVSDSGFGDGGSTRGARVTTISTFGISASVYSSGSAYTSAGCGSYFFDQCKYHRSADIPLYRAVCYQ